jgi:hypothetical protein
VTSSWFFLSTLNYDARSTTHQIYICLCTCWYKQQTIHNARYVHQNNRNMLIYLDTNGCSKSYSDIYYVTWIIKCLNCVQTLVEIIGNKICNNSDINCTVFMKRAVVMLSIRLAPLPAETH